MGPLDAAAAAGAAVATLGPPSTTGEPRSAVCVHRVTLHGALDEFVAEMHGWEISAIQRLPQVFCSLSPVVSAASPPSAVGVTLDPGLQQKMTVNVALYD